MSGDLHGGDGLDGLPACDGEDASLISARHASGEIHMRLEEDPVFYSSLRARLEAIIETRKERRIDAAEQLKLFASLEKELEGHGEAAQKLGLSERAFAIFGLLQPAPAVLPLAEKPGPAYVRMPADLPAAKEAAYARAALLDWYLRRAGAVLPARVRRWARRIGVEPSRPLVTFASTRWGSASKDGTVRLNWRVIQAAGSLIDYVIAHELVHLAHAHHGTAFWSALGKVMPDYDIRKERLSPERYRGIRAAARRYARRAARRRSSGVG